MTMHPPPPWSRYCPDNNINNNLIYLVTVTTYLIYYFSPFSFDSEHNKMLCGKVVEELAHEYGGPEKCPWSVILIKGIYCAGGLKVNCLYDYTWTIKL